MSQFREIRIVLNQRIRNISSKMDNKGLTCIFTEYSLQHGIGVFRMFNLQTQRIIITRDVLWLNLTYGQYIKQKQQRTTERTKIYNIQVNDSAEEANTKQETTNNKLGREQSSGITNNQLINEFKRLHTSYNPRNSDMVDYACIGGTDEEYEIPNSFSEAWHHHDKEQKHKWKEAINKEIQDWTKRGVLEFMTMEKKPPDRKLLGSKWAFKVKQNGVFRA